MQKPSVLTAITLFMVFSCGTKTNVKEPATAMAIQDSLAESMGWRLGAQSYSMHNSTLMETVALYDSIGLRYIEIYHGQKLGGEFGDMELSAALPVETLQKVRAAIEAKGMKVTCTGVVAPASQEEWKAMFEFAKIMGIETITAEPLIEHMADVDKMANEYRINVGIHNHPTPSPFDTPDKVLKALEGRSSRMGASPDISHWVRTGLEPMECLKMLEGKLISFHFNDVKTKDSTAEYAILGQGVVGVLDIMKELKRQGFKGVFSIEDERNDIGALAESVKWFHQSVKSL
jgi:sugar phosphate isomerase/epimerase